MSSVTDPVYQRSSTIYPNPANEMVYWRGAVNAEKIVLKNATGQYLGDFPQPERGEFDVSNLPAGVYFLEIFSGRNVFLEKLIVR
ncbi:MAG TPA: T9SS type A sorting domain-containing protein [Saprospiraceae bacterium]|nr:T9SS type A sorting domain-containing protein [Saprospiraceae bacterium]